MTEKLLKQRRTTKAKKPTFKRVQAHQFSKLNRDTKWRKPKGMGNKVRRNRRGKPSQPTVGYGSPKIVRGLNRDGLLEIVVSNVAELSNIDSKTQIAVISSNVGAKKRIDIINEAKKLKLNLGNVKDLDKKAKELTKVKKEAPKKEVKKEVKADKKSESKDGGKKE